MIRWLWMVGLLLFLSACDHQPRLTPLSAEATVLAFGDSLTWGTGGGENGSYPAQLEKLIGRQVVNAGIAGETSAEGLQRLATILSQHHPQLLILCHGGNDLLRRLDRQSLQDNLRAMIVTAQHADVEVLLIGVPNPGLMIGPPDLYAELAEEFKLPYLGEILAELESNRKFKSDTVHLNADGYHKLARSIKELLETAKAI